MRLFGLWFIPAAVLCLCIVSVPLAKGRAETTVTTFKLADLTKATQRRATKRLERAVRKVKGVTFVALSKKKRLIRVRHAATADLEAVKAAIGESGFTIVEPEDKPGEGSEPPAAAAAPDDAQGTETSAAEAEAQGEQEPAAEEGDGDEQAGMLKQATRKEEPLATSLVGTGAMAQEEAVQSEDAGPADGYHVMVVGVQVGQGEARTTTTHVRRQERRRWSYSGVAYFDYYLFEMMALEVGAGVVMKGHRFTHEEDGTRPIGAFENYDYKLLYMQVPVGVKLNVANVRLGLFCALDVGVLGTVGGVNRTQERESWDVAWSSSGEDGQARRLNVAPKVALGYAFPVRMDFMVLNLEWSMDLLGDTIQGDENRSFKNMNIMLNVALELGI